MDQINYDDVTGEQVRFIPVAESQAEVRLRHASNRQSWDQGALKYREWVDQDITFFREGKSSLHPIERANIGPLRPWCHTAVHLQCASGRDTLSLLTEGAERVVGLDFSAEHINNARHVSEAVQANAAWYCCDVLDAPAELNAAADLVYTGRGALCWLHDLPEWARVVARILKPGGLLHLLEDHPVTWLFNNDEATTLQPSLMNYFQGSCVSRGWSPEYIGDMGQPDSWHALHFERLWTLSDIVMALIGAGLTIQILGEYPDQYWNSFARLNPEHRRLIPMTLAVKARKTPAAE